MLPASLHRSLHRDNAPGSSVVKVLQSIPVVLLGRVQRVPCSLWFPGSRAEARIGPPLATQVTIEPHLPLRGFTLRVWLTACLSPRLVLPARLAMVASAKSATTWHNYMNRPLQPQNTQLRVRLACKCPTCLCSALPLRCRYRAVGNGTSECRTLGRR